MRILLASLAALLAVPVGLLAYCHHLENPKFHFATVDEARRNSALGNGLAIPERLLPDSATDIVLQYDMDTQERWLTYSFAGARTLRLPDCTADPTLDVGEVHAPWWWSRAAAKLAKNAEKYRCVDRGEFPGFWVEYRCVLILGSSEAAWSCDSGRAYPSDRSTFPRKRFGIIGRMPDPIQLISALLNNLSDQADVEESAEWYLRSYLVDYKRTLLRKFSSEEIEFATGAFMRFCEQSLDTTSALYRDCIEIAEEGARVGEQLKAAD